MPSLRLDLPFDKALEELTIRLAHDNTQAADCVAHVLAVAQQLPLMRFFAEYVVLPTVN